MKNNSNNSYLLSILLFIISSVLTFIGAGVGVYYLFFRKYSCSTNLDCSSNEICQNEACVSKPSDGDSDSDNDSGNGDSGNGDSDNDSGNGDSGNGDSDNDSGNGDNGNENGGNDGDSDNGNECYPACANNEECWNSECVCKPGEDCSVCEPTCTGNRECKEGECVCKSGYYGDNCIIPKCFNKEDCNNNGTCENYQCNCIYGFSSGDNCKTWVGNLPDM